MNYDPPGAHGEHIPTSPSQRPGMVALSRHLMAMWGGTNLGIYNNRSVRGGSSTSLHAVSRAFDWGYTDRARGLRGVDWLIANADRLGVQAIHDYADHRGNQGRTWGHGRGWHYASIGSVGGHWFHVELTVAAAGNAQVLSTVGAGLSRFPPFDPAVGKWSLWPLNAHKPTLEQPTHGDAVRYFQGVARLKAGHDHLPIDGDYGNQTASAARDMQQFFNLEADGLVGPKTWGVVDMLSGT